MSGRLVHRDGDKSIYEADDGTVDHIEYGAPQMDGTLIPSPMMVRADQALDGLKTIRDSTGALTLAQLSNAVRLLATVVIALVRLRLGRRDDT